jgi:hypothetical protein
MDNNSALESGSSVSETNERYEENEVVWAKIQGYPWWPAYVILCSRRLGKSRPNRMMK